MLTADGADGAQIQNMKKALKDKGAVVDIIALKLGDARTDKRLTIPVDKSLMTVSSVLYDAVYIPGGSKSVSALMQKTEAVEFISQAYKHCKAIAFETEKLLPLIEKTMINEDLKSEKDLPGIIYPLGKRKDLSNDFIKAIARHRFWEREKSPV